MAAANITAGENTTTEGNITTENIDKETNIGAEEEKDMINIYIYHFDTVANIDTEANITTGANIHTVAELSIAAEYRRRGFQRHAYDANTPDSNRDTGTSRSESMY